MNNNKIITIDLADKADRAVRQLFGHDALLTHSVSEITDQLRSDIQRISSGQSAGPTTLALVGRVGEGKSWLTRTFLAEDDAANQMIRSECCRAQHGAQLDWKPAAIH
jgi:putative ribosome biogenesis GTPase RsgA